MTLDMSRVDLQRSETVTLLDTNRRWEVTLTNGGTPFRLPNNWTASLVGVKPDEDENGLMLSCSVVDGRIIFDFAENEQLTTCAGAFPLVFDVWNEYGELIASPKIWIHVLPDVRPHEDLQSTGQYTTIGELIAAEKANREDIDKNASDIAALDERVTANADEIADNAERIETNADNHLQLQDRLYGEDGDVPDIRATLTEHGGHIENLMDDVVDNREGLAEVRSDLANFLDVDDNTRDQLSEVLSLISANEQAIQRFVSMGGAPVGSGTLVVPAGEWSDGSPTTAYVDLPGNTLRAGSVMLLTPANDATKEAASKARLSVSVDVSGDYGDEVNDVLLLLRAETAAKPAIDMEFAYVILQTTATTSLVTLIGVDAAGDPAPTLVDLSGFEGVEQEDGSIKGKIVETYADETTRTTSLTYDGEGNIVQIGATVIKWTADAGEEG
jgi:hypothetical protein